jgi:hypothetical protein
MTYVVLIGGRAGEGKTTFAQELRDELIRTGKSALIVSFAQGVKDTARFMGWDGRKDDRGRKLLQAIGGSGRDYDLDIWANKAVNKIRNQTLLDFALIDDWRFPNEEAVLRRSFESVMTIRIARPPEDHLLIGTDMYNDPSEASLDQAYEAIDYDCFLTNESSLDVFLEKARRYASILKGVARGETNVQNGS